MRIHPEAISPGRWPLLNPQKLGLSWIHFLNEIPLEIRDWQGYTRIWLPIIYDTIFIIEGNGMFLFAQSFKRPQCLNLKEPGSFVVMWIPQWWRCFCQRKLEKVRSVQLPSMGVFRLLSPFSGHTSKCLIRIYILYAFVLFCFYIYTLYTYYLFTRAGIEAGKYSVTERRMFIKNLSSQNSTASIGFHWSTGGERNLSGFTKWGNHVELPEMLESFKSTSTGQ